MAESDPATEDLSRSRSRSLSSLAHASKWREKLKEKAGKLKGTQQPSVEEQQNDVSEFLGKTSANVVESRPMNLGLKIPVSDTLDPTSYAPAPTYHRKPKKPSKGLTVRFSDALPEVIGVGGDECEVPSMHVIGSWANISATVPGHLERRKSVELPQSLTSGGGPEFLSPATYDNRQAVRRTPTRRSIEGWEQKRLSMNMEEGLVQAYKGNEEGPSSEKADAPLPAAYPVPSQQPVGQTQRDPPPNGSWSEIHAFSTSTATKSGLSADGAPQPSYRYQPFNATMSQSTKPEQHGSHRGETESLIDRRNGKSHALPIQRGESIPWQASTSIGSHPTEARMSHQSESDEFYSRVQHLRGVFRLAADKAIDIEKKSLEHWLTMASWWFIRGQTSLEQDVAGQVRDNGHAGNTQSTPKSHQCYVDLAKAWWAMEDIIPKLLENQTHTPIQDKNHALYWLNPTDLLYAIRSLQIETQKFAVSMQRRELLPPPALLIQGADPSIWLPYPTFPPGILSLTAFLDPRTLTRQTKRPIFPIIFNDSERYFSLSSIFTNFSVLSHDQPKIPQLPCLISTFRERSSSDIEMMIVSQDGSINLHIQTDPAVGPVWENVRWNQQDRALLVGLTKDFLLTAHLSEHEFGILYSIYNHARHVRDEWHVQDGEEILFDEVVPIFLYTGNGSQTGNFPTDPITRTSIRLMQRSTNAMQGGTARAVYDGFSLMAKNSSMHKNLYSFRHVFGKESPVYFSNLRGEYEAPALLLASRNGSDKTSLVLTFKDTQQRAHFFTAISGMLLRQNEVLSQEIPLLSMEIAELTSEPGTIPTIHHLCSALQWSTVKVITKRIDDSQRISFNKRICLASNLGSVIDLASFGTGELQIGLDIGNRNSIKLYRPAQDNLILTFSDTLFPKEQHSQVQQTLRTTKQVPTARIYTFATLEASNSFQQLVTGFEVLHDCLATSFSISHRRNMIPLYKKQEATSARLQILCHENRGQKTFQLVAVLADFPNGKIMNFMLRSTDVFEATTKSGKHCIRFADAKFALPNAPENTERAWDMVCLDAPEYPSEHDDIIVGFDAEAERDAFAKVLPAPVKVSRLASLRR